VNPPLATSDFFYHLPDELIANFPTDKRSASRLLCLDRASGSICHRKFSDLPDFLSSKDLLVFNDTRVIPARLFGNKETGGKVELLIERVLDNGQVLTQLKSSKPPSIGSRLFFPPQKTQSQTGVLSEETTPVVAQVVDKNAGFYKLQFLIQQDFIAYLESAGHIPLPPYIKREDNQQDKERYQTVYNRVPGAVAAPTAGLHFDESLLNVLAESNIATAFITLHVGAGTFQPVRAGNLEDHKMHSERVNVSESVVELINRCKQNGGRVVAVGTTTVRSLESAAQKGSLSPFNGETDIFIYPGFEFKVVDAMITNFHLPESTLLMLLSAFAEKELILNAYEEAVAQKYRFFSYGDAMFIS
jgi:S-adenosylmethionine:tRNA ribosyltransferase-isomerase